MPSPHWAEVRFLGPPLSKWSAISSDMKVFKSTSWSPFLLRLLFELLLTWVGEPGVLERTLMLAIAPLSPAGGRQKRRTLGVASGTGTSPATPRQLRTTLTRKPNRSSSSKHSRQRTTRHNLFHAKIKSAKPQEEMRQSLELNRQQP